MNHMSTPKEIDFMTHAMRPVIREVHQQEKQNPIPPGGIVKGKECKIAKKYFVNADAKYFQKQAWELRRDGAAHVGYCVWQTIKIFMGESLHD